MSLKIDKLTLPSADFNGESSLPSIYGISNTQQLAKSELDEDDELFVGYGFLPSIFPYRMQDMYNRATKDRDYICVTLENSHLKARFLPELGGRLYSLYDKDNKRDLLYVNPVIRPCNLAVRNAWLSGGVEFNCGMVGHHPFTCSQIFAATASLSDSTPVLRMYEFERIRACVYQMDFFLPEDSRVLYARIRIVNPNRVTTPMYWWSNIAVREDKKARNVIPATETYNNVGGVVGKNKVPYFQDRDITYPSNNPTAVDFFWKIPQSERKFTSYLNKNGYGLIQFSTSRQQGRKLFVWGQGPGGERWQQFLTADGQDGKYVEIQAGVAHTQYECLPMPPLTAWEWLEGYGALSADAGRVHGEWCGAVDEVKSKLDALMPADKMEQLLKDTHDMATSPAEKLICKGSGWGALENLRRGKAGENIMCPHLDFGVPGDEQKIWLELLNSGKITDKSAVDSWMLQSEWTDILEKAEKDYAVYLQLAAVYFSQRRFADARSAVDNSLQMKETAAGRFIQSQLIRIDGDDKGAAKTALYACELSGYDLSYTRQSVSMALTAGLYDDIKALYKSLSKEAVNDGRLRMYYAYTLLRSGDLQGAENELWRDGGISVTDIREGEISITGLYLDIQEQKSKLTGAPFDRESADVPSAFDFRMHAKKKAD